MADLETKKTKAFEITEMQAADAPVTDVKWYGDDLEARTRIEDPATGKAVILRVFEFEIPKDIKILPTKEQMLAHHRSRVIAFLWKDELDLIGEPRIVKTSKRKFKIFATAMAKKGSIIPRAARETMKPLQDILQNK